MRFRRCVILSAQIIMLTVLFAGCSGMLDVPVKRNPGVTTASPSGGYSVAMVSGTLDVTIVLDKKPADNVTIPVSLSSTTYATIAVTSVTFTPDNWYSPQPITITGSGYALPIGNQNLSVVFGSAVSSDPVYNGMFTPSIPIVAIGNFPGITVSPTLGLITYKSGISIHTTPTTFTVVLNTKPTNSANVTIPLASSDVTEGTIDKSSLVFSQANWNVPQKVTITGANNGKAEGSKNYTINLSASTTSPTASEYTGLTSTVSVTNMDDITTPVLIVAPNTAVASPTIVLVKGASGSAAGASGVFTVCLESAPSSTIIYPISNSNSSRCSIDKTTLTFTTSNWDTPQTVTATPIGAGSGNVSSTIVVGYDSSVTVNTVAVDIIDPTAPNVVVSSLSRPTNGSGQTAYFTVYLTTQPTADVTVPLNEKYSSKNSSNQQGTVDTTSLTFTTANYATPQTVVVTGVDDYIFTGNVQYYIKVGAAASTDADYNTGKGPFYVTVNNNEIDVPGIVTSQTSGMATDTQGNLGSNYAHFTICLKSKPTANVTLNLTASPSYGSLNTPSLTFTPSNWNSPQTVTVTGSSGGIGHGGTTYSINTSISTTDTVYNSTVYVTAPSFSIFNCDNTTNPIAYCRLSGASTGTTQSGGTATFYLITKIIPSSTVSVTVLSDDILAGGTALPVTANITSSNWNTLGSSTNRIVVTGSYNGNFTSDITYHVGLGSSTGGVTGYTVPPVTVVNTHISLLTIASVTTSTDQGGIGSFTVKMNIQPTADVTFTVSKAANADGVASSSGAVGTGTTDTLTFTNSNWSTPQTVYIKGDTYNGVRGDKTSTVTSSTIISADSGMNGYQPLNGTSAVTCREVNKLVWVSNKTYVGNFNGGITQIDLDSTDTSDTNRPTGIGTATYKALIVDGASRVATTDGVTLTDAGQTGWVLQANTTYYRYTGILPTTTVLFTTNSYKIPASLNAAFTDSAGDTFWTGLNSDWTTSTNICGEWKLDTTFGEYGSGGTTGTTALDAGNSSNTVARKLIFVQQ